MDEAKRQLLATCQDDRVDYVAAGAFRQGARWDRLVHVLPVESSAEEVLQLGEQIPIDLRELLESLPEFVDCALGLWVDRRAIGKRSFISVAATGITLTKLSIHCDFAFKLGRCAHNLHDKVP